MFFVVWRSEGTALRDGDAGVSKRGSCVGRFCVTCCVGGFAMARCCTPQTPPPPPPHSLSVDGTHPHTPPIPSLTER